MYLCLLKTACLLVLLDFTCAQRSTHRVTGVRLKENDLIEWRGTINKIQKPSTLALRTSGNNPVMVVRIQGARNRIEVWQGRDKARNSHTCSFPDTTINKGIAFRMIIRVLRRSFMIYINGSLKIVLKLKSSIPDSTEVSIMVAFYSKGTEFLGVMSHEAINRELQEPNCGRFSLDRSPPNFCPPSRSTQRIVGGVNAHPGSSPWQVALRKKAAHANSVPHMCGGTLIGKCWVVSAAHCFISTLRSSLDKLVVRVGDYYNRDDLVHSRMSGVESSEDINIRAVYLHEQYSFVPSPRNDIALIQLERCATFGPFVAPACIPRTPDMFPSGTQCGISGWGAKQSSDYPTEYPACLQTAMVSLKTNRSCASSYGNQFISDKMMCAANPDIDACRGDSGGPLVCSRDNVRYTLWGITSWGKGCGESNNPGVYTRVSNYLSWMYALIKLSPSDDVLQADLISGRVNSVCVKYGS